MFFIGTDEAGYGPNFGPLVIAATVWQVSDAEAEIDLYDRLDGIVTQSLAKKPTTTAVPIADSKRLYKPGGGWEALEYGVWAALAACGKHVDRWRQAWKTLCASENPIPALPWYRDFDLVLPRNGLPDRIAETANSFAMGLTNARVRLHDVRAVAIFPADFNDCVNIAGSKGALLSQATLRLIKSVAEPLPDGKLLIHCDKHGGRNKYGQLLQKYFPEYLIEVHEESRPRSRYRFGPPNSRTEIRFVAKGESFLPSALASMFAKYLRELAMHAFNEYWAKHVPGIKPTAGYPVDAKRFKEQIAVAQQMLEIDDHALWRSR